MSHAPSRLPLRILLALVLGGVVGGLAQAILGADHPALQGAVKQIATPVGRIFLNLIFMVVVPLLFSALVLGVAEIGSAARVGRIGLQSLAMTVLLSSIAVGVGLLAVNWVAPGQGLPEADRERLIQVYETPSEATKKNLAQAEEAKPLAESLVELVPRNPLQSAVNALEGGLLPFMVFALVFGIALASIEPERALPLKLFFESLFAVTQKVIEFAMQLAPIGVFALVFSTAASLGVGAFLALGKYAAVVLAALAFQQFVIYSGTLQWIARRPPREFFRQIRVVMLTAFATASSNATLPTALKTAEEEVGLPKDISSFVLTVGATANQNGTALFEGVTILFLAQLFGVSLDLGQQMMVMGLAIVAGVGTAGVPGGAWPMIAIILAKIGVPPEAIGICLGIDRILDMSRTVLNVTGDLTIAACVARFDGRGEPNPAESTAG